MRIVLFGLASALCLCARAVPRVEVPPQGVAFGEITAGVETKGSLELSNTGDSPLGVSRVKACCGATAELVPMTVSAGGRASFAYDLRFCCLSLLVLFGIPGFPGLPPIYIGGGNSGKTVFPPGFPSGKYLGIPQEND